MTLEKDDIAYFLDAPTQREIKHIRELIACQEDGYQAYLFFVIQMKGVVQFRPNNKAHPAFGEALRQAKQAGVHLLAYDCFVTPDTVTLDTPVPLIIEELKGSVCMKWHNFWGHLKTITKHRHMVIRHCCKAGIFWQGLWHDLSKYSPTEFFQGVKYYQGNRSPNEAERENTGCSLAWMHHKGRNRHHFEYWTDYNTVTKCVDPVQMPMRYLAEMFCDRVAASKIYKKDQYNQTCPLTYFQNSGARKRGALHPKTEAELMELLEILAEQGEKAAFQEVRHRVKVARRKIKVEKGIMCDGK